MKTFITVSPRDGFGSNKFTLAIDVIISVQPTRDNGAEVAYSVGGEGRRMQVRESWSAVMELIEKAQVRA